MSYHITESKQAQRSLVKIQPKLAKRIREKLRDIANAPYSQHNNVTKLQNSEYCRLRVGDWRVIYEIIDEEMVILVLTIKPRGKAYDRI